MPFTPRNDHAPRFADGLAGQNPAARITPVAPFWPPGLPEGRTGRRGYPGLRHAKPEPRRAGQTESVTPRPLERRVGLRAGTTLRPPTEPKRKRAAQPETRAKAERGDGGRTACTTPGWNTGGLEQTGTPRTTTKAQKTTWCKRMLSLPAQPRPNNALDSAARRAFALSSTRPTPELRGAGGPN